MPQVPNNKHLTTQKKVKKNKKSLTFAGSSDRL